MNRFRKFRFQLSFQQPNFLELQPFHGRLRTDAEKVPVSAGLQVPGSIGAQGRSRSELETGCRRGKFGSEVVKKPLKYTALREGLDLSSIKNVGERNPPALNHLHTACKAPCHCKWTFQILNCSWKIISPLGSQAYTG